VSCPGERMVESRPPARRPVIWLLTILATVLLAFEPGLFLVVLAVALFGLAIVWALLLVRAVAIEWLAGDSAPVDESPDKAQHGGV